MFPFDCNFILLFLYGQNILRACNYYLVLPESDRLLFNN